MTTATSALSAPANIFLRDRLTWLGYLMLAYYAYLQSAVSPLMNFLGEELHLSYTVRALHLSAFALGMIIAGLTADRAAARFGRARVFWAGGAGMALGAVLLTSARTPAFSITATLIMGTVGSYTLVMIQALLADLHGERRAQALTESNVVASIAAALAPVLVSTLEAGRIAGSVIAGFGWRLALWVGVGAWALLAARFAREAIPRRVSAAPVERAQVGRLPRAFWRLWFVVLFGVSIEWSVIFWGAEFLETSVGLDRVTASGLMSVFLGAMVVGRAVGSRLTRLYAAHLLLLAALGLVAIGFPIFWLSGVAGLNIAGLFICGLGVANLFPLSLSAAAATAPDQVNTASARVSLAAGLAILIAPQLLGSVGDSVGISAAFAFVAVFVIASLVLTWTSRRAAVSR